jgi:hypothetical protein
MEAVVDVRKQDGKTLADASHNAVSTTQVFESQDDGAEAEVRRVIAMNSAGSSLVVRGGAAAHTGAMGATGATSTSAKATSTKPAPAVKTAATTTANATTANATPAAAKIDKR